MINDEHMELYKTKYVRINKSIRLNIIYFVIDFYKFFSFKSQMQIANVYFIISLFYLFTHGTIYTKFDLVSTLFYVNLKNIFVF